MTVLSFVISQKIRKKMCEKVLTRLINHVNWWAQMWKNTKDKFYGKSDNGVWCFIQKKTWNYLIFMLGEVQKKKVD